MTPTGGGTDSMTYPITRTTDGRELGEWDGELGGWDAGALNEIGRRHGTNKASWDHGYLTFYEALTRTLDVRRVLELGVFEGASIRAWREYWPDAEVIGVDVNGMPDVPGATLVQADAGDERAMSEADPSLLGPFDLVIDDATHQLGQIDRSLRIFGPRLRPHGGLYIIEDTLVDGGPWYVSTDEVLEACRRQGYAPIAVAPGRRWVVNGDDRGLWAFVAFST